MSPQLDSSRIEERVPFKPGTDTSKRDTEYEIPLLTDAMPMESVSEPETALVSFKVQKISLKGNSVLSESKLQDILGEATGDEITLHDLRRVAAQVTRQYQQQGYIFSRAHIPQQTINNDTVMMQAVEGYIADIEYRGISVEAQSVIDRYGQQLMQQRPITSDVLERYILLINDLAGLEARVITSAVEDDAGAMQLIFLMTETAHQAEFSINNRGSDPLGSIQGSAAYHANNLTGLYERTSLVTLNSLGGSELRLGSLSQSWPVGADGASLAFTFRHSEADPSGASEVFDIDSKSNFASLALSYPWIRSRQENMTSGLTLDARHSFTESFDTEIIDDKLLYLRGNTNYNLVHDRGVTDLGGTLSLGIDVPSLSPDNALTQSRQGGKQNGSHMQFTFSRYQQLDSQWSLMLGATGQYAFDPLLSAELFGIGGSNFGRGFDFSTVIGDSGYAASLELGVTLPYDNALIKSPYLFSFLDGGMAYDRLHVNGDGWQGVASSGFGGSMTLFDLLNFRLEVAKPVAVDSLSPLDRDIETYVSFGLRFDF